MQKRNRSGSAAVGVPLRNRFRSGTSLSRIGAAPDPAAGAQPERRRGAAAVSSPAAVAAAAGDANPADAAAADADTAAAVAGALPPRQRLRRLPRKGYAACVRRRRRLDIQSWRRDR